jgi:hypothetical protein
MSVPSGGGTKSIRKDAAVTPMRGGAAEPFRSSITPQIVPLEDTSDLESPGPFLREFASESPAPVTKLATRNAHEPMRLSSYATEHAIAPAVRPRVWQVDISTQLEAARRLGWRNISLGLLAILVVIQAGFIVSSMFAADTPPTTGSVTVTSSPSGSPVKIDGTESGVTPLTASIAAGNHLIEVGAGEKLRGQYLSVTGGGSASMHIELVAATPPAAAGQAKGPSSASSPAARAANGERAASAAPLATGWMSITSGIPMQVLDKGKVVGTSEMARILLPAGEHEFDLVNDGLGYRVTRKVEINAGHTTNVELTLPMGSLSVNALPWAEVWIDGQRAGETPIGNFSIAIGNHEVLFRHPDFGEQRRTVAVGAAAPARIGVDMKAR